MVRKQRIPHKPLEQRRSESEARIALLKTCIKKQKAFIGRLQANGGSATRACAMLAALEADLVAEEGGLAWLKEAPSSAQSIAPAHNVRDAD
ncbi:MAG: hypothetical protein HC869_02905 [Rhodospirillales bacterium]|nr:hypothetical protein [Rhodospirillales bacterium]